MAQLTNKRNVIDSLLKSYDKEDDVRRQLSLFEKTMTAFAALHQTVQDALPVEERESDHKYWYLPRYNDYKKFKNKIHAWLENAPANESCKSRNEHDNMSTTSKSSSKSTGSSIRRQAKAKKAESLTRAATLENKLQLEREELELKAKKERLAIDTDIAVSEAQIRAMDLMDNNELQQLPVTSAEDRMNEYFESAQLLSFEPYEEADDDDDDGGDDDDDDNEEDESSYAKHEGIKANVSRK